MPILYVKNIKAGTPLLYPTVDSSDGFKGINNRSYFPKT